MKFPTLNAKVEAKRAKRAKKSKKAFLLFLALSALFASLHVFNWRLRRSSENLKNLGSD